MNTANMILLWAAAILSSAAILKECIYRHRDIKTKRAFVLSDKVYYTILTVAVILALGIRLYKFGTVPGGFNQDGAMAAVDAKALADYGTDRFGMRFPVHLTAWGTGQMSCLLSYLMVPFIKLFSLTPITARLPQLIVSCCGLLFLYLFAKDSFGRNTALVIFIFAAINPWHIMQSRWALDCNLYPHFFIMGIYFLNKFTEKGIKYLIISMIMFGLSMYCYGISIYTMPVFLAVSAIYLVISGKISKKGLLTAFIVYILVAWPFIAVMTINCFRLDTIETPLFTIPFFPQSTRSGDILFFSQNKGEHIINNLKSLCNVAVLQKKDAAWNDMENFGSVYKFSIPFAIVGVYATIKNHRKSTGAILSLIFLFTGILSGIMTNNVNINRLNIIFYPIIIMSGVGISFVTDQFYPYCGVLTAAAYITAFAIFTNSYFTNYAKAIENDFFKDFGDAVSSVADSDCDKFYITADTQYEGASKVSEILTMFYHKTDARYYQGKKTIDGLLPYSERYSFIKMKDLNIDPDENACYVINSTAEELFDKNKFRIKQFGKYSVAVPK